MDKPVSSKLARHVLKAAQSQGYDTGELIANVGLDFDPLNTPLDQQPESIPAATYNRLYKRIIWLFQDEAFGLHLKQRIPAGSFRMMCLCVVSASSLQAATERAAEFMNFCRELSGLPAVNMQAIDDINEHLVISHLPSSDDMFNLEKNKHLTGIIAYCHIWRQLLTWLIQKPIQLAEVHISVKQTSQVQDLELIFGCPVKFEQNQNGLVFDRRYLDYSINHDETSLSDFLRSAPYQLTFATNKQENDIVSLVIATVGGELGKDFPSLEGIAEQLNMSVRTLRRRLANDGSSYRQLKDQLRRDAACQLLKRPNLKITAVSALMGFDEPSAFHRSFKKWSGMTPGEYRKTQII